jgi:hypothetical protein
MEIPYAQSKTDSKNSYSKKSGKVSLCGAIDTKDNIR